MTTRIREGRTCDAREVLSQIGTMTVLAVSGGRVSVIRDNEGETIGVSLPCGGNRTVEVTLSFWDTYTVRRYRTIVNGARRGESIVEHEATDIYCDQISEAVLVASFWR